MLFDGREILWLWLEVHLIFEGIEPGGRLRPDSHRFDAAASNGDLVKLDWPHTGSSEQSGMAKLQTCKQCSTMFGRKSTILLYCYNWLRFSNMKNLIRTIAIKRIYILKIWHKTIHQYQLQTAIIGRQATFSQGSVCVAGLYLAALTWVLACYCS